MPSADTTPTSTEPAAQPGRGAGPLAGVRDVGPILLGLIPFGMIVGVSGVGIGMPVIDVVFMSAVVFAGAAQLATVALIGASAAPWVVLVTVGLINLRHLMYSAALAPLMARYSTLQRLAMAYFIVDHTYTVGVLRYRREDDDYDRRGHWLGMGVVTITMWLASTALGALVGAQLPSALQLDFALPLMFLGLLVPVLRDRPAIVAAVVAGVLALVFARLPYNLGLVAATLCGVAAGTLSKRGLDGRDRAVRA